MANGRVGREPRPAVEAALNEETGERIDSRLRLAELEAVDRAGMAINAVLGSPDGADVRVVLHAIIHQAVTLTGAGLGALAIGDEVTTLCPMPGMPAVLSAVGMNGLPVRIKDVRAHPVFNGFPASHPRISNVVAVAIPHDEMTAGTLFVANKLGSDEFSDRDERCLAMFARRISHALQIVRLNEGRAHERERLELLADTGRAMPSSLDLLTTLVRVARLAIPRLADCCIIYLCKAGQLSFGSVAHRDPDAEQRLTGHHQRLSPETIEASIFAEVARTGQAVMKSRAADGPDCNGLDSYIGVPILSREKPSGVMLFAYSESSRRYASMDLALLEEVAFRAALTVDNARLYQEATAALRAHDNLLAIVSHDLRNPLNSIFLNLGLLTRSVPAERRRGRSQLDLIKQSARRLNRLVQDLVTASTIEAGHFSARPQPERVAGLLEEVQQTLEPTVADRGVSLHVQDFPGDLKVLCDLDRLLQVFENLFSNALEVTPVNGRITVTAVREGAFVCFQVADTGPGIAPADQPFVFDRYWKREHGQTGSVGLALSIVKGIVSTHGGRVWLESELEKGASFFFTLPVAS
jgi:signal transduction histidine kinase